MSLKKINGWQKEFWWSDDSENYGWQKGYWWIYESDKFTAGRNFLISDNFDTVTVDKKVFDEKFSLTI